MVIKYRRYEFVFETNEDDCWYNLDGAVSEVKGKKLIINADRDVYANFIDGDKEIEGYIVSFEDEKNPIADNYLIDEERYHFKKLKNPGYYL